MDSSTQHPPAKDLQIEPLTLNAFWIDSRICFGHFIGNIFIKGEHKYHWPPCEQGIEWCWQPFRICHFTRETVLVCPNQVSESQCYVFVEIIAQECRHSSVCSAAVTHQEWHHEAKPWEFKQTSKHSQSNSLTMLLFATCYCCWCSLLTVKGSWKAVHLTNDFCTKEFCSISEIVVAFHSLLWVSVVSPTLCSFALVAFAALTLLASLVLLFLHGFSKKHGFCVESGMTLS